MTPKHYVLQEQGKYLLIVVCVICLISAIGICSALYSLKTYYIQPHKINITKSINDSTFIIHTSCILKDNQIIFVNQNGVTLHKQFKIIDYSKIDSQYVIQILNYKFTEHDDYIVYSCESENRRYINKLIFK